jgi:hypothetical protein
MFSYCLKENTRKGTGRKSRKYARDLAFASREKASRRTTEVSRKQTCTAYMNGTVS